MSSFLHSIRWRIQAWHGVILFLAIGAFCVTAYHFAWDHQMRRVDRELQDSEHLLIRTLMDAVKPDKESGQISPEELARHLRAGDLTLPPDVVARFASNSYFSIRDFDGRILLQSASVPDDLVFLPPPKTGFSDDSRAVGLRRESLRSSSRGFSSVIGRDITRERDEMHRFAWLLAGSGLGVWFLGLLGGWWLAGRAIKPIATISRTASRIAEGNLADRIDTTGTDSELDQLSHVLNRTFDRLHTAFERQRQFTADASHELRTPLTILLAETQRMLKRERTPAEYQEALRICHDTSERMRHLVEALLLLARQEASPPSTSDAQPCSDRNTVVHQSCNLADILGETIAQLQPLADARGIKIETHLHTASCCGDRSSLAILAANLVGNALHHHRSDAPDRSVTITTGYDDELVFLIVSDNGPGIPVEDQTHIFERFYRVDKARTGDSAHTGLGLAIAKTIVGNHRGTIKVQSVPGAGATFTVSLPAAS
ncbi:MAG: HAMP domain-containing sensor histidine kinase [Opitutaceae bacterium]|jgi:signal transduction histidine kinase